jgi:hypothetical protein
LEILCWEDQNVQRIEVVAPEEEEDISSYLLLVERLLSPSENSIAVNKNNNDNIYNNYMTDVVPKRR